MKNLLDSRILGVCCALTLAAATALAQNPFNGAARKPSPVVQPASTPKIGSTVYNVRAYGATGDGKTVDSDAVNKAIDAAAANGGGTVYFPAGYYLCFSIHLKTNITLYLDQGSWIVAAETPPEVTALQPQGGRGFGGGGGGGGGGGAAGAAGTGGRGGRGGPTPTPPRIRGAVDNTPAPTVAPVISANDFQAPVENKTVQDFLAKVPPGTHMYDLAEKNMWYGLPAWRPVAQNGALATKSAPVPGFRPQFLAQ